MTIDWTPLADLIETHDRFLVTTHVRPDGDALGSEVGMAGLLRQRGKDVRVVNSSPTPPRYDFLDPELNLFEHFGHRVQPAELADREVAVILDLSSWNQLGDMAGFIRQFRRAAGGHRPPRERGRPGGDRLQRLDRRSDRHARHEGDRGARMLIHSGSRRGAADGHRDGHRLVPALQHHEPARSGPSPNSIEAGARVDDIYRKLFERNTLGRLKLMGETLVGHANRPGRKNCLRDDIAAGLTAHRRDPAGFGRPGRLHGQHAGRRGRHAVHRTGPGGREGVVPGSQRPGLLATGRPVRRRRTQRAAGATVPGAMAEIVERVLVAVRAALASEDR